MKKFVLTIALTLLGFVALVALFSAGLNEFVSAQQTPAANGAYKYIATNTTTIVKPTSGYLHTVTINGGTAGVVTLYDIAAAGCTGTPASGKFATILALPATNPVPVTLIYDLATVNGICVVTAAATDATISFN